MPRKPNPNSVWGWGWDVGSINVNTKKLQTPVTFVVCQKMVELVDVGPHKNSREWAKSKTLVVLLPVAIGMVGDGGGLILLSLC